MKHSLRSLPYLLVCLAAACRAQDSLDSDIEYATLNISLTSTQGKAMGKTLVILRLDKSATEYRRSSGQGAISFAHLPFNVYEIEVQASGFSKRIERLRVYQPEQNLRIGLSVSPIHPTERSEIVGSITTSEPTMHHFWVRLVPMYSSDLIENTVSSSGEFRLGGLFPGRFILLVFSENTLVKSEIVDYTGGKQRLDIAVTDDR